MRSKDIQYVSDTLLSCNDFIDSNTQSDESGIRQELMTSISKSLELLGNERSRNLKKSKHFKNTIKSIIMKAFELTTPQQAYNLKQLGFDEQCRNIIKYESDSNVYQPTVKHASMWLENKTNKKLSVNENLSNKKSFNWYYDGLTSSTSYKSKSQALSAGLSFAINRML